MNEDVTESERRLNDIRDRIARAHHRFGSPPETVTLVAVSKTFGVDAVRPLLDAGQRVFGENRVQEAMAKWPELQASYDGIELHLIGPLQTNKARDAVSLFDVIQSVDREKLAAVLSSEMTRANRRLPVFVQVNIGMEPQKAGIAPAETEAFVRRCRDAHGLNVAGLMCIPPEGVPPGPYFAQLAELARDARVDHLSMGMSADFETAIMMGATHVRVGSALFGQRPPVQPA